MNGKMNELISVVIPAFNAGSYLNTCLDSVLAQTYRPIEIILVDDGSTDETPRIADKYRGNHPDRISVIHTENKGVVSARFTGIGSAKGEWIGFVDADDEIEPDMYEHLYSNAVQYRVDISHCGFKLIVNDGERTRDFYNTGRLLHMNSQEGIRELLDGFIEPSLCNKLYRRSLLKFLLDGGRIDPSIKYNEDLLMNYYLFASTDASIYEDFCGYHYVVRQTSATRGPFRPEKLLDPVRVFEKIVESSDPPLKELAWRKYLVRCCGACYGLRKSDENKESIRRLRMILKRNKDKWRLLNGRERVKVIGTIYFPKIYDGLYRFYEKYIQKNEYE